MPNITTELWTPQSEINQVTHWGDFSTIPAGPVASAPDLSGGGRDFFQTEASRQPQSVTWPSSTLQALSFDGVTQRFDFPEFDLLNQVVLLAFLPTSGQTTGTIMYGSSTLNNQGGRCNFDDVGAETISYGSFNPAYVPTSASSTFAALDAPNTVSMGFRDDFYFVGLNGNYEQKTAYIPGTPGTIFGRLSNLRNPNAQYYQGLIGEYIAINARNTALRQMVEGYLADRWGSTLEAGHPYENGPPLGKRYTKDDPGFGGLRKTYGTRKFLIRDRGTTSTDFTINVQALCDDGEYRTMENGAITFDMLPQDLDFAVNAELALQVTGTTVDANITIIL